MLNNNIKKPSKIDLIIVFNIFSASCGGELSIPSNKSQQPFFNEIINAESQSLLNLFAGIIIFPISILAFLKISLKFIMILII